MKESKSAEAANEPSGYVIPQEAANLLAKIITDNLANLSRDAYGTDPLKAKKALEIMDELVAKGTIKWKRPDRETIIEGYSTPMELLMENLIAGDLTKAAKTADKWFPFKPEKKLKRTYTQREMLNTFFRDGFVDRYSGERLYNPGFLRLLNVLLPDQFPYDAHGHFEKCHEIYWDLMPSLDHQTPLARGGKDEKSNWITTSMRRNMAKGPWSLQDLGWRLHAPGSLKDWDGGSAIFVYLVELFIEKSKPNKYIMDWYRLTKVHPKLPKVYEGL
ncbi:hypothetical protein [Turneriella parva]|nr:hypothetical protein [Turneriella parva]